MRAYLLGRLPDDRADELEQEYFVNRAFFLKMQSAETALISEYLDGTMPLADTEPFENRYLHVPELRRKLEGIRARRSASPSVSRSRIWIRWSVAVASLAMLVVAFGLWIQRSRKPEPPAQMASNRLPAVQSFTNIRIKPGITKGPDSRLVEFEQPTGNAMVNLVLELPSSATSLPCLVRISMVMADGHRNTLWKSSAPIVSVASDIGQVVAVPLPSSLLQPGDYVAEVSTSTGDFHEAYIYRVIEGRGQQDRP